MPNYCTTHKQASMTCHNLILDIAERKKCAIVAKKPSTRKTIKEPAPKKIKTTCEKRLPSGNYCKKQREFTVQGHNQMIKQVCATHLPAVILFLSVLPNGCTVRPLASAYSTIKLT